MKSFITVCMAIIIFCVSVFPAMGCNIFITILHRLSSIFDSLKFALLYYYQPNI
ncbi:hypothetical protein BC943DRAFT_331232 [Umbelopsis sp. AD052]|nr:hypothetical protein BC943DRAFT_331232 [Umbelopsis sp. AD052]